MSYSVEYEVCALLFLLIVTVRFFEVRQFPNQLNRLFGVILYCAIADLSLDILGVFTISNAAYLPIWVNYAVNTAFYSLQVCFPVLMMTYVLQMAGKHYSRQPRLLLLLAPFLLFIGMLLVNPWSKGVFYLIQIDGLWVYSRGPYFSALYFGSCFYLVATLILILRYRERLQKKQFTTILGFQLVVVSAMLVQYVFPQLLLTGVAIAIAILMMFFTLQNPEDMLDLITGVFNYSALIAFLKDQIAERQPIWLIAIDVGGMRRINSTFGVQTGNAVLHQVGLFLNEIPVRHWPFRMISTRFLLITTNETDHLRTLELIRNRFQQNWTVGQMELQLDATVRHLGGRDLFQTPEDVINLIDDAYTENGPENRGNVLLIDQIQIDRLRRRTLVENALRTALRQPERFYLCYQPLYAVKERRFTTAEALLRLNDPDLGPIPPAEFIPVAEKTGLIYQIDELVVNMACSLLERQRGFLQRQGMEYLEVNLSAAEFFHNVADQVEATLAKHQVAGEMLCFEVTETAAATHPAALTSFMKQLNDYGCRFALDDFGTGFANITQVLNLPFSIVKLDRSLLLADDEKHRQLFADLLRMFHRVGIETVVEGVETEPQLQLVESLQGDFIQGFYYSYPLPEQEFLNFLSTECRPDL